MPTVSTPSLDVTWALAALRRGADDYAIYAAYYEGRQRLAFATEKFRNHFGPLFREFAINHCALCVDVPSDRLQFEDEPFKVVAGGGGDSLTTAFEIWRRNRMKKRAGEVHSESLKTGDAYIVVDWANPSNPSQDRATIYPNLAGRCAVRYDDENPGYIIQAARWWTVVVNGGYRVRLNIYFRDRIEKYQTNLMTSGGLPFGASAFSLIPDDPVTPNKYNKVPVFHFANNADIGSLGRSELKDIIPPQNGVNKIGCDAMVGAEFTALGQRYAVGVEVEEDANGVPQPPFHGGLDHLFVVPPQKDKQGNLVPESETQKVTFGQFTPASLEQLLALKGELRKDISLISGIPAHYFMDASGGWPSGEALKTAEQRLTSKVMDRQIAFGMVWEDVMRFCLEIEGQSDVQLETQWKDAAPVAPTATQGVNTNVD